MGRIEELAGNYERHIALPWQRTLAGSQRVIMVVYDKDLERTFRARKAEFKHRTLATGHGWVEFDCTAAFSQWMAGDEYRDAYFETPGDLALKVDGEFRTFVAQRLATHLRQADEKAVVAVTGVASLFGLVRMSDVLRDVEPDIRGRLVVFFPGHKDGNNYRLLDARDGWNYLAAGITLQTTGVM